LQTVCEEVLGAIASSPLAKSLTVLELDSNLVSKAGGGLLLLNQLRLSVEENRKKQRETHGHNRKMDFGYGRFRDDHEGDENDLE